ncbi:MAG: tyrosine-protein phosphatase [Clostridia bacterium]|nr:tyrosine-protein phosphatase [Clostridia bacterium]
MKRTLALVLVCLMSLALLPASAEEPAVTGKVTEIEKYGHALLDITIEDFNAAGFALGDIVTVTAGTFTGDMPYFNGYYVDRGEYMVRAYPGHTNIAVCINYGKFAETAGIGVGDTVTIALKEKGGALTLQEISNLVYTNERADYASDAVFANFRPVAEGKLYRSASPVDNQFQRAAYADALIQEAGVQTVMNMANTEEEISVCFAGEGFNSPYYKGLYDAGNVIVLGLPINFDSDEFGEGIVKGFAFLAAHDTPYLVHCTEGKDRAGFASMVLEALMGWSEQEIVADYMTSYENYYGIEPGTEKYDMIAEKNIAGMLRSMAGVEAGTSLEGVDLQAAARDYLTRHGMTEDALKTLEEKLR